MAKMNLPSGKDLLGTEEVAGHVMTIHRSLNETFKRVDEQFRLNKGMPKRRELLEVAREIAKEVPTGADVGRAADVVKGHLQNRWYLLQGKDVPMRCVVNQSKRIRLLRELVQQAEETQLVKPRRKGGTKIADVIKDGILQGLATEEIIKAVKQQFPESNTGPNSIAYYKVELRKKGLLDPVKRGGPKPRKESAP